MPRGPVHTAAARRAKKKFAKDQHGKKMNYSSKDFFILCTVQTSMTPYY